MPSRIRIGPDGGPYVIVEENNGDLDITTPDNTIDLQNSGLINAALSGVLDAQNNDISNVGTLTADSLSTEVLGSERHYAGAYDGADADARLDAAVSAASPGDSIYLENATYTGSYTFAKTLTIIGTGQDFEGSTIDGGTWTFDSAIGFETVGRITNNPTFQINSKRCYMTNCYMFESDPQITVSANEFRFVNNRGGDITFESETVSGIVDACTKTVVTDKGTNTVGDIA